MDKNDDLLPVLSDNDNWRMTFLAVCLMLAALALALWRLAGV